ncbi:hypothetical protein AVEN_141156-1 [Araneus ventricosus]|uniref:Uncharacterized protein n=1 Tax=Araneus ventricosus TaxID=182803 RepID=A0A4Y2KN30_ARAVE|nr:hypothetical protein AVEN_141156-1 [Araneus ventricosus]
MDWSTFFKNTGNRSSDRNSYDEVGYLAPPIPRLSESHTRRNPGKINRTNPLNYKTGEHLPLPHLVGVSNHTFLCEFGLLLSFLPPLTVYTLNLESSCSTFA